MPCSCCNYIDELVSKFISKLPKFSFNLNVVPKEPRGSGLKTRRDCGRGLQFRDVISRVRRLEICEEMKGKKQLNILSDCWMLLGSEQMYFEVRIMEIVPQTPSDVMLLVFKIALFSNS